MLTKLEINYILDQTLLALKTETEYVCALVANSLQHGLKTSYFLSFRTSTSAHLSTNSQTTRPGMFWLHPFSTVKTWWQWSWLWTRPQDHISLLRMKTWVPTTCEPTSKAHTVRALIKGVTTAGREFPSSCSVDYEGVYELEWSVFSIRQVINLSLIQGCHPK